jgi:hypothetical protein
MRGDFRASGNRLWRANAIEIQIPESVRHWIPRVLVNDQWSVLTRWSPPSASRCDSDSVICLHRRFKPETGDCGSLKSDNVFKLVSFNLITTKSKTPIVSVACLGSSLSPLAW